MRFLLIFLLAPLMLSGQMSVVVDRTYQIEQSPWGGGYSIVEPMPDMTPHVVFRPRKALAVAVVGFVGGAAFGVNQMILHHKADAARVFGSNRSRWDPDVTWRNKYRNGDPNAGERFPGSTTVFAFTTDLYHATNKVSHLSLFGMGATIGLHDFKGWKKKSRREKWRTIETTLAYGALGYAARGTGFHLMYTVLPKL